MSKGNSPMVWRTENTERGEECERWVVLTFEWAVRSPLSLHSPLWTGKDMRRWIWGKNRQWLRNFSWPPDIRLEISKFKTRGAPLPLKIIASDLSEKKIASRDRAKYRHQNTACPDMLLSEESIIFLLWGEKKLSSTFLGSSGCSNN